MTYARFENLKAARNIDRRKSLRHSQLLFEVIVIRSSLIRQLPRFFEKLPLSLRILGRNVFSELNQHVDTLVIRLQTAKTLAHLFDTHALSFRRELTKINSLHD